MVNLSSVGETSRGGLRAVASTQRVGVCPKEEPASNTISVFVNPCQTICTYTDTRASIHEYQIVLNFRRPLILQITHYSFTRKKSSGSLNIPIMLSLALCKESNHVYTHIYFMTTQAPQYGSSVTTQCFLPYVHYARSTVHTIPRLSHLV